jgi:hypothetical protein
MQPYAQQAYSPAETFAMEVDADFHAVADASEKIGRA